MRQFLVVTLIAGIGFCSSAAGAERSLHEIVTSLRHHAAARTDAINTDVPQNVASDLAALKHALRDLICKRVTAGAVEVDLKTLRRQVVEDLEGADVPIEDWGSYGSVTGIELSRPREYPEWLVATTTLGIPYGADTSLYLFQLRGDFLAARADPGVERIQPNRRRAGQAAIPGRPFARGQGAVSGNHRCQSVAYFGLAVTAG